MPLPMSPCTRRRVLSSFLLFAASAPTAQSALQSAAQPSLQPGVTALDPVVVTAARASQPIAHVLADVTVIGADEIQRSGVQSLAELLQRQPGVEIDWTERGVVVCAKAEPASPAIIKAVKAGFIMATLY